MTRLQQPVRVLLTAAADGDQTAWKALVDRYAALVWSICLRSGLSDADAADVSQTVWLRVVESLSSLREPEAFPGWLATTTRRECIRVSTAASRHPAVSVQEQYIDVAADEEITALDAALLEAERDAILRQAFAALPEHCRRLLAMLFSPEPHPYTEVAAQLNIPTGTIGPTRARCLRRLRRTPELVSWLHEQHMHQLGEHKHA